MKRFIFPVILALTVGFIVWFFLSYNNEEVSFSFSSSIKENANELIESASDLLETSKKNLEKTISAPPPLRAALTGHGEELTIAGVLEWTNMHREEAGLPPLTLNTTLSDAAALKVNDMFTQQYFAHVSPDGVGPANLVEKVSYAYLAVGENLALGIYDDDEDLVQAWMDSPGHRENIIATQFSEIGLAVAKNEYEGHDTWLAVQTFARPSSACPAPSENLSAQITTNKSKLEAARQDADLRLADIESTPEPNNTRQAVAYNIKVDRYNDAVALINEFIEIIQGQVTVFNGQVQAFNACVKN